MISWFMLLYICNSAEFFHIMLMKEIWVCSIQDLFVLKYSSGFLNVSGYKFDISVYMIILSPPCRKFIG